MERTVKAKATVRQVQKVPPAANAQLEPDLRAGKFALPCPTQHLCNALKVAFHLLAAMSQTRQLPQH